MQLRRIERDRSSNCRSSRRLDIVKRSRGGLGCCLCITERGRDERSWYSGMSLVNLVCGDSNFSQQETARLLLVPNFRAMEAELESGSSIQDPRQLLDQCLI